MLLATYLRLKSSDFLGLALVNENSVAGSLCEDVGRDRHEGTIEHRMVASAQFFYLNSSRGISQHAAFTDEMLSLMRMASTSSIPRC